jgi:glyoxylase-like metal-dependent hydrolase (beta-lactamase superfamily II)
MASATPNVMIGLRMPEHAQWSPRVTMALGMNPGLFTGPGTNTYLVGTGRRRILIDTGQGAKAYLPALVRAMAACGCDGLQEIILTHGHVDHRGGIAQLIERFGALRVSKLPGPEDGTPDVELTAIGDGAVIETEGATLRALHTPGHASDHLCFWLDEESALFSGDNVLGVGTTVIPAEDGDLALYLTSLARLEALGPKRIYPAHGPLIEDGVAKLREYLAHRAMRETQIIGALRTAGAARTARALVSSIYTDVPEVLHAAAAQSVTAHLMKLEREGRVRRHADANGTSAVLARWSLR